MIILILLCIIWVCGALLSLKVDAVLTGNPTDYTLSSILVALIFWIPSTYFFLTCQHHVTNIGQDRWDY